MPDEPLQLSQPEDGTGTTGWIARMLGVSPQSIAKWVRAGMPTCGVDPRWGGPVYDLAACRAWRTANRPERLHGGARRGAGRKPEKQPAEMAPLVEAAAAKVDMREAALARLGELGKAAAAAVQSDRVDFDNLSPLTASDLRLLAYLEPAESGFSAAQANRLQMLARSQRDQMEIAERRGLLHDAASCDAARMQHLTLLRTKLLGLPGRAAPVIVAEARLGPELVPVVKSALMKMVDEMMREIAGDPMGAEGARQVA